jgi:threonine aldolase
MKTVDLRSDTITHPTDEMRRAMANAKVGDDVFGEDPTVIELEKKSAERIGKEAGLFVPSGTMGNLVSLLAHCPRGGEMIVGDQSHILLNEVGGSSALGGIHPRTVANNPDGTIDLNVLKQAIRPKDLHYPPTSMIALENTHNYCQGTPLTVEYSQSVGDLARKNGLALHLDGARLFNAAIALKVSAKDLSAPFDSVMFCLSKGLSAPVGSLVCGSGAFIRQARKYRKMVGGGMRQSGILAATGLIALETMVERLAEDHSNAQLFALGISRFSEIDIDPTAIKTNIVFFKLRTSDLKPEIFLRKVEENGLRILMMAEGVFRAVFHREISKEQAEEAILVIKNSFV